MGGIKIISRTKIRVAQLNKIEFNSIRGSRSLFPLVEIPSRILFVFSYIIVK